MWREATRGSNDTAGDFAWAESTPFYREELARIKSVVSEATAVTPDLFYFFFFRSKFSTEVTEEELEMFAFYATVRQPCSYYVTYSKLSRFYTTFQMDHYGAGSDRDDRPPPEGGAGAAV
jgi:hypothetical protein